MTETKKPEPRLAAIVCAAGSGTRFGRQHGNKLDADLLGEPVLIRAVEALARHRALKTIVVAGPPEDAALARFRGRYQSKLAQLGATICAGGRRERYETVSAALSYLTDHATTDARRFDAVLIHDAARACVPFDLIAGVIDGLSSHQAVVPAIPIPDTIRRAGGDEYPREAESVVDRLGLFACQTPQGFHLELLQRAYGQTDLTSTDDAQLVERLGEPVTLVSADPRNIKITLPRDLDLARAIWPTLHAPI